MGILDYLLQSVFKKPSKFIYSIFVNKDGKRKKKRLLRGAGKSNKTYLERHHFGNFSPIKKI